MRHHTLRQVSGSCPSLTRHHLTRAACELAGSWLGAVRELSAPRCLQSSLLLALAASLGSGSPWALCFFPWTPRLLLTAVPVTRLAVPAVRGCCRLLSPLPLRVPAPSVPCHPAGEPVVLLGPRCHAPGKATADSSPSSCCPGTFPRAVLPRAGLSTGWAPPERLSSPRLTPAGPVLAGPVRPRLTSPRSFSPPAGSAAPEHFAARHPHLCPLHALQLCAGAAALGGGRSPRHAR